MSSRMMAVRATLAALRRAQFGQLASTVGASAANAGRGVTVSNRPEMKSRPVVRDRAFGVMREEGVNPPISGNGPIRVTQCINNCTVAPFRDYEFLGFFHRAKRAANQFVLNDNHRVRRVNNLMIKHACKHIHWILSITRSLSRPGYVWISLQAARIAAPQTASSSVSNILYDLLSVTFTATARLLL